MRIVFVMMILSAAGCMGKRPWNPATTQPVTNVDPQLAEKDYWLAKPATAEVHGDFDRLWQACEDAAHDFFFKIDRRDQRSGLMTTEPLISKQWWEWWRNDTGTLWDSNEATLLSMRRTIFFQFHREPDGGFSVTPKVLVERQSKVDPKYKEDIEGPSTYWYAVRRDEVVEKRIAKAIRHYLDKAVALGAASR